MSNLMQQEMLDCHQIVYQPGMNNGVEININNICPPVNTSDYWNIFVFNKAPFNRLSKTKESNIIAYEVRDYFWAYLFDVCLR